MPGVWYEYHTRGKALAARPFRPRTTSYSTTCVAPLLLSTAVVVAGVLCVRLYEVSPRFNSLTHHQASALLPPDVYIYSFNYTRKTLWIMLGIHVLHPTSINQLKNQDMSSSSSTVGLDTTLKKSYYKYWTNLRARVLQQYCTRYTSITRRGCTTTYCSCFAYE